MVKLNIGNATVVVDITYVHDQDTGQPKDTYVRLLTDDGREIATGMALLHWKDKFNKRTGRKVAFADALDKLQLDKETRAELWAAFLGTVKR